MAAITDVDMLYFDASGNRRVSVMRIRDVTSGDTIDLSSIGSVEYEKVLSAAFLSTTAGQAVVATLSGSPQVTATLTLAGMANDTVVLTVEGLG